MGDIPVPQARYFLLRDKNGVKYIKKTLLVFFLVSLFVISVFCAIGIVLLQNGFAVRPNSFFKVAKDHGFHRAVLYSKLPETNISIPKLEHKNVKNVNVENYKLVCYYNYPSESLQEHELSELKLDPNLCTHLVIGFSLIVNNTIVLTDQQKNVTRNVVELKKQNKNLKILLSVGGAHATAFPQMVLNHANRKTFIRSMLSHIKEFKLDGIDLDWEFPNEDSINTKQRMHFTQLLREIREEINRQKKHKFLISVAAAAPYFVASNSYDISYMNEYVDFVNLMTYDFHFYTKITPFTGINSPLFAMAQDVGIFGTLNINYSANFWISQGMSKDKIVIGLPTYGHSYRLLNSDNNRISAPALGYGSLGHDGFVDYNEVCAFLSSVNVIPNFDVVSKSPYATYKQEWVSFDDVKSLTYKAEYVKNNNFGGAMVYALNTDDHKGDCLKRSDKEPVTFPLTKKIRDILYDPQL